MAIEPENRLLQGKQEIKYVQISVESYSHLTGLEDRVKSLKLAAAQSEMTNKENLGKQYAKVAEEAISSWEKAAKQFDKMKHEFEAKLANLDQQLLWSAAENFELSRSLQESTVWRSCKQATPGGSEENCKIECRASEITWSCVEEVSWAYSLGPDKA
ncbi:hypothetical protein CQW23_31518 [Capsicum baccatum]|uniref:Uncharacterized protein n=1 Tax=Capsicum baccatum TaxID=33114 RepID=A0A2G2V7F7_CAPBA|nr:hypothetical protein CQW23_31518 [Capsicum baccatum]